MRGETAALRSGTRALAVAALAGLAGGCGNAESTNSVPAGDRVAEALLAAPESLRRGATVLGYREDGTLQVLRAGEGPLVCLADDPRLDGFHVACYQESLEPYMARGRELRAEGLSERESLAARWREARSGRLKMPDGPAVLYSLTSTGNGSSDDRDVGSLRRLTVLYVPYADAEETGLPTGPGEGVPWLMFPGTPTAHVMIHR